jgi:hypothetical protein
LKCTACACAATNLETRAFIQKENNNFTSHNSKTKKTESNQPIKSRVYYLKGKATWPFNRTSKTDKQTNSSTKRPITNLHIAK